MSSAEFATFTEDTDLTIHRAPKRERWLALRRGVISSTQMAAIAGIHKYGQTRWSIYQEKVGAMEDPFVETERTEVGRFLERSIAQLVAERINARVLRLPDFLVRGKMGASFDYVVADESHERHGWLVEIKNVDRLIYKDQWIDGVAPEHIQIQVQSQLEVSRREGCILATLVGGNELILTEIARDRVFGAALRQIADQFWADVEARVEPDVTADDAEALMRFYTVSGESVLDASHNADLTDQAMRYFELGNEIKIREEERQRIKAGLVQEAQDRAKIVCAAGYTVDLGWTKASEGTLITPDMVGQTIGGRAGYRRFVVRKKKGAE